MENINDDDIIIASTGFISREVFRYDRPLNFYMMGAMGNCLAMGIGLSMNVKQRVFVLDGDGAVLMSLGTKVLQKVKNRGNLIHIVLDNNCHESTGGQPTISRAIDFRHLSKNTIVYYISPDPTNPPRITLTPDQITKRFKSAIEALPK